MPVTFRFIRGHQDADGDVTFRASFTTHGGITSAAIVDFVGNFEVVMREIRKRLRRQSRTTPAGARTRGNALVH